MFIKVVIYRNIANIPENPERVDLTEGEGMVKERIILQVMSIF